MRQNLTVVGTWCVVGPRLGNWIARLARLARDRAAGPGGFCTVGNLGAGLDWIELRGWVDAALSWIGLH